MPLPLDPHLTLDAFVVGAGNRLAYAAARRVAEAPGTTYNPLFVYSASGLGKTHLLMGIGHEVGATHAELNVVFETLEGLISGVTEAIESGRDGGLVDELGGNTLLLLDDVQFLAGQHRAQEELLRIWDHVTAAGGQVVLTSDRPPPEIDGLDDRLLSRFSGGLIMDIAAPDFETRVAIVRRKAEQRQQELAPGVAEAIARTAFGNVRELQGGLNRVLAAQELEGRAVTASDVPDLLGRAVGDASTEFDSFLAGLAETVEEAFVDPPVQRQVNDAVERWRGEGYETDRLERALEQERLDEPEALIRGFERDVERLREVTGQVAAIEPDAPELERLDVLRDPERIAEAESLLAAVRDRHRPLPPPPSGGELEDVDVAHDSLAMSAARSLVERPAEDYNPLFLYGPADGPRRRLMAAAARAARDANPELEVAFLRAGDFVEELIDALEHKRVEGWRARYRRAGLLFLDEVEALEGTERAQEEVFHLFDRLLASGAHLIFGGTEQPSALQGVEERLRTRLGSGLVVEVESLEEGAGGRAPEQGEALAELEPMDAAVDERASAAAQRAGASALSESAEPPEEAEARPSVPPQESVESTAARPSVPLRGGRDDWFRSPEKLVWQWPYAADWLTEELN